MLIVFRKNFDNYDYNSSYPSFEGELESEQVYIPAGSKIIIKQVSWYNGADIVHYNTNFTSGYTDPRNVPVSVSIWFNDIVNVSSNLNPVKLLFPTTNVFIHPAPAVATAIKNAIKNTGNHTVNIIAGHIVRDLMSLKMNFSFNVYNVTGADPKSIRLNGLYVLVDVQI